MIGAAGKGWIRYVVAVGFTAAAVGLRLAIDQVVTIDPPFLVFFPAILAAALWCGPGPALLSTLLSGLVVAWYWVPPRDSLAVSSPSDVQGLVLFALSATFMTWLVESNRKTRKRDLEVDQARLEVAAGKRREEEAEEQMAELSRAVGARTEELREREALMQGVVETAVDAIMTIDEAGIVRSFNPSAERMFGYTSAEVVGKNVSQLMPSPHRESHDSYLHQYLTTGMKKIIGIGREITARRKDGSTFPMYLSVSEVLLPGRRIFTGFVRDLTEQKRLEQEFLHSQKMETVGSLSGAIAHDFNNILMGILACSRVASEELPKESPARESFDEIAAAANRGVALTRRLLAFSRRGPPQELRPTSIDDVLRENEKMLRQLLGEDIALRVELSSSGGSLLADPGLIDQIVINLLVNARDAMPKGGVIHLSTRTDGQEVVMEVKDTGCGIPADLRRRIFEPFFTTKGPDQGTGLGLSTVKRITEHLNGRIDLESEVGRGTSFRLAFPRCEPAPRPAPPAAAARADPKKGRKVLLVEDDALVRASLLRFLGKKGYEVKAAASPSEASSRARTGGPIDVLLTDMVLPETTGSELAKRLRADAPLLKVIYMSAHPIETLIAQGHLEPGAPYLEKPFEMEELESLLERVLAVPAEGGGTSPEPSAGSRSRR